MLPMCGVPTCLFGQNGLRSRRRDGPERVQGSPGSASGASGSAPAAPEQTQLRLRNGRAPKITKNTQKYFQKSKTFLKMTNLTATVAI